MKRKMVPIASLVILVFFAAAAFAFTTEQANQGKEIYVKNCAVCHGASGQGGPVPQQFGNLAGKKAPALVGKGALPGMKDAGQVYQTAKKLMPADKPGSLKDQDYLDVVSFALQANGIKADNKPLTPESAKKIKLGKTSGKKKK